MTVLIVRHETIEGQRDFFVFANQLSSTKIDGSLICPTLGKRDACILFACTTCGVLVAVVLVVGLFCVWHESNGRRDEVSCGCLHKSLYYF